MKKSELKEAIKAEIKSVLSEDINEIEFRTHTGLAQIKDQGEVDGADAITKELRQYNLKNVPDMDAYADGFVKGAANKAESLMGLVGLKEGTWSSGTYNEIGRFIQDVKNLRDKYYDIVGNDDVFDGLDRAEEAAREMMIDAPENKSDVTFSDIREDEMSDEEKDKAASKEAKKKDSIATISNKLQKLTAKMKKKAKEFKEAEGKAKDKIKDELKDMTAEKKKLEKAL